MQSTDKHTKLSFGLRKDTWYMRREENNMNSYDLIRKQRGLSVTQSVVGRDVHITLGVDGVCNNPKVKNNRAIRIPVISFPIVFVWSR